MRTRRRAAAGAVCLSALLGMGAASAALAQPRSCRPAKAAYRALATGMRLAAAKRRLGCAGRRVSHLTIGHRDRATYSWYGRGSYGANITLTFVDGRLTDKSQLGLR